MFIKKSRQAQALRVGACPPWRVPLPFYSFFPSSKNDEKSSS